LRANRTYDYFLEFLVAPAKSHTTMQTTAPAPSGLSRAAEIGGWVLMIAIVLGGFWLWFQKSDDRRTLLIKWGLSLPGVLGFYFLGRYLKGAIDRGLDYGAAFFGATLTAALGVYFAIIWRREIAELVARPFGALYDGGNQQVEPAPFYSIAEAKRKRGKYPEAMEEIRKQLEKFPTDFTGQMLLAEIEIEDLKDLPAAAVTIQRICQQSNHAPRNIAYALNTLADWHLKYALDPDAAREALEQIVARLPDSEFALLAEQRIGHLASREFLTNARAPIPVHVPEGVRNIGLLSSSAHLAPATADPTQRATELVNHLNEHPQDTEAREQLAILYADHYQRLDLAGGELSQIINQPNQPARSVIRWINLLADIQVRHGSQYDTVAETLTQIIERYPNHAAADLARNRLDLLRLELKAKQAPTSIKLGTYEQNIGLKYGRPDRS
jgi:outer membrane protein assembly factor BamD (BamD/ComL family)